MKVFLEVITNGRGYGFRLRHKDGIGLPFNVVGFFPLDNAIESANETAAAMECEVVFSSDVQEQLDRERVPYQEYEA
jgi:hypothetical protein